MLASTRRDWHAGAFANVNGVVVIVIAGMHQDGIMQVLGQPGGFGEDILRQVLA